MFVRRALYFTQPVLAVLLPAWLLVGWGAFGPDGWPLLVVMIMAFLLCAAMFAVVGLTFARSRVRRQRAVSWLDVVLLVAWDLSLVGIGFYAAYNSTLAVVAILLGLGAFWASVWQLVRETADRVQAAFRTGATPRSRHVPHVDHEHVIIVHESRHEHPH